MYHLSSPAIFSGFVNKLKQSCKKETTTMKKRNNLSSLEKSRSSISTVYNNLPPDLEVHRNLAWY